ncbi:MAG: biotin/lipoyl-containing protein [Chloroflexota bacterium]|nr:biotin/lipoyl-containing protein [Chloroflexota bacterium]
MALTTLRIKVGDKWYSVQIGDLNHSPVEVTVDGELFEVEIELDRPQSTRRPPRFQQRPVSPTLDSNASSNDKIFRSPMPGKVMSILVKPGQSVKKGDELCVVEAMKMEQSICSTMDGTVKEIYVQPLDSVNTHDPLIELE